MMSLAAEEWTVPADAAAVRNPVPASAASVNAGKALYETDCLICHGASGRGDGAGGVYLEPKPTNLIDPAVLRQTDGALFWKISTGRSVMLGWATVADEADRWNLVNYLRSLAPAAK